MSLPEQLVLMNKNNKELSKTEKLTITLSKLGITDNNRWGDAVIYYRMKDKVFYDLWKHHKSYFESNFMERDINDGCVSEDEYLFYCDGEDRKHYKTKEVLDFLKSKKIKFDIGCSNFIGGDYNANGEDDYRLIPACIYVDNYKDYNIIKDKFRDLPIFNGDYNDDSFIEKYKEEHKEEIEDKKQKRIQAEKKKDEIRKQKTELTSKEKEKVLSFSKNKLKNKLNDFLEDLLVYIRWDFDNQEPNGLTKKFLEESIIKNKKEWVDRIVNYAFPKYRKGKK